MFLESSLTQNIGKQIHTLTFGWTNWSFGHHKIDTNIKLYNKYIKGEK